MEKTGCTPHIQNCKRKKILFRLVCEKKHKNKELIRRHTERCKKQGNPKGLPCFRLPGISRIRFRIRRSRAVIR